MPKTALLAAATLLLAMAALVTDVVSPYSGPSVMKPAQVRGGPAPSLRVPVTTGPREFALIGSVTPRS